MVVFTTQFKGLLFQLALQCNASQRMAGVIALGVNTYYYGAVGITFMA